MPTICDLLCKSWLVSHVGDAIYRGMNGYGVAVTQVFVCQCPIELVLSAPRYFNVPRALYMLSNSFGRLSCRKGSQRLFSVLIKGLTRHRRQKYGLVMFSDSQVLHSQHQVADVMIKSIVLEFVGDL